MSHNSYYDIDAILAEQESVTVVFRNDAYDLGKLLLKSKTITNHTRLDNNEGNDILLQSSNTSTNDIIEEEDADKVNDSLNSDMVEDEDTNEISSNEEDNNQRNRSNDVLMNTRTEIPFWLARLLGKKHFVMIEIPKWMKALESCDAGWHSVNLNSINPYFYTLGHDMASYIFRHNWFTNERRQICEKLQDYVLRAFTKRFTMILFNSSNSLAKESITSFTRMLCLSEERLFRLGQKGTNEYEKWKTQSVGLSVIKQSELLNKSNNANPILQFALPDGLVPRRHQNGGDEQDHESKEREEQGRRKRGRNNDGTSRVTAS